MLITQLAWEADTLPTELRPQFNYKVQVVKIKILLHQHLSTVVLMKEEHLLSLTKGTCMYDLGK